MSTMNSGKNQISKQNFQRKNYGNKISKEKNSEKNKRKNFKKIKKRIPRKDSKQNSRIFLNSGRSKAGQNGPKEARRASR